MIIPTASDSYLLLLGVQPTKGAFLERAQVMPGTYAEELMGDIYDEIFHRSRELKREYQKYYSLEYPCFSVCAANFRWIPSNILAQADHYYDQYAYIIRFASYQCFLNDDEGLDLLARLLNLEIKSQ